MRGPVRSVVDSVFGFVKDKAYGMAFTRDLVDWAKDKLPSVVPYSDLLQGKAALKEKFTQRVEGIVDGFRALGAEERGVGPRSVNALVEKMTRTGEWAYEPEHLQSLTRTSINAKYAEHFNSLTPEGKKVVRDVFEHGYEALKTKQDLVVKAIHDQFEERLDAARTSGDTQEIADVKAKRDVALLKYETLMKIDHDKPYAPLQRFGNYVSVARSEALMTAIKNHDNSLVDKLMQDPQHYVVEHHDTEGSALAAERELRTRSEFTDGQIAAFPKESVAARAHLDIGSGMAFTFDRLKNLITKGASERSGIADASPYIKHITGLISDLHISMLSESSARKSELIRKNVSGNSADMMRAFATQSKADAHFMAALSNNKEASEHLENMHKEARAYSDTSGEQFERMRAYNEFLMRHANSMAYRDTPIQNSMARVTSGLMLAGSPAHYLQTLSQTPLMTLPYIAGRFGYAKTVPAMIRAYREMGPLLKAAKLGEKLDMHAVPEDVRRMVSDLIDQGKLGHSISDDLGNLDSLRGKYTEAFKTADRGLRNMQDKMDELNRLVSTMTAYRLHSAETSGASHGASAEYASRVVLQTHGDYSGYNSPRYMNANTVPMAKVLFQFRKFQLIQLSMMARLVHNSFEANSPEYQIARKQLAYTVAHAAVLGGAMGMPGVGTAMWAFNKLFGDPNEPGDGEHALRKMIGDPQMAALLTRGVPALLGNEGISRRMTMADTTSLTPFQEPDLSSRAGAMKTMLALSGPFIGGVIPQAADAVGKMMDGRYYEGLEGLMPLAVRNAMKAGSLASQGLTNSKGDTLVRPEDLGMLAIMSQALGLPSTSTTDPKREAQVVQEYTQKFHDREKQIVDNYARAVKGQDTDARSKAIADFSKLQATMRGEGFRPPTFSALYKSPMEQAKRERNNIGGVEYSKRNRAMVQELTTNNE